MDQALQIESIEKEKPKKKLQIWFEDESRFGLHGRLGRLWSAVGVRPDIPLQTEYEWAWMFGAVCPEALI
jgi:hypothetical protein